MQGYFCIFIGDMNEIDSKILQHIWCDYQYGVTLHELDHYLFEEQGIMPGVDKYIQGFLDVFDSEVAPYIKEGGTYATTINNPSQLGVENPFFTTCKIEINASIREGVDTWKGGYNVEDSVFNDYCKYLVMKFTAGSNSLRELRQLFSMMFSHEITHAYDDYMTYVKGGKSLKQAYTDSAYQERILSDNLAARENKPRIGRLLYLLSPIERNAIIGQLNTEIGEEAPQTPQQALAVAKKTHAYKNYLWMRQFVNELNSTDSTFIKQSALEIYTKWIGYNKRPNKNHGTNYDIRKNLTYEGFLKEINNMFRKWEHKFLNSVGKIAYINFLKSHVLGTWSESNEPPITKNGFNEGFERERIYTINHRFKLTDKNAGTDNEE